MPAFLGMVELGDTLSSLILVQNASRVPVNADSTPTYRIYGPSGLIDNGTGTLTFEDSGAITGVAAGSPPTVTSNGHNLQTGMKVTVAGVGGMGGVNGDWLITVTGANTFTLTGATGTGTYTPATGTWNVSGAYNLTITPQGAQGYQSGRTYEMVVYFVISGTTYADTYSFQVA